MNEEFIRYCERMDKPLDILNERYCQLMSLSTERLNDFLDIIKKKTNKKVFDDTMETIIGALLLAHNDDFDDIYKMLDNLRKNIAKKEGDFNKAQ